MSVSEVTFTGMTEGPDKTLLTLRAEAAGHLFEVSEGFSEVQRSYLWLCFSQSLNGYKFPVKGRIKSSEVDGTNKPLDPVFIEFIEQ
jgi:hypothetical protein